MPCRRSPALRDPTDGCWPDQSASPPLFLLCRHSIWSSLLDGGTTQRCVSICTAFLRTAPRFRSFRANNESFSISRSSNTIIAKQEFSIRRGSGQIALLVHEIRVFVCTGPGPTGRKAGRRRGKSAVGIPTCSAFSRAKMNRLWVRL